MKLVCNYNLKHSAIFFIISIISFNMYGMEDNVSTSVKFNKKLSLRYIKFLNDQKNPQKECDEFKKDPKGLFEKYKKDIAFYEDQLCEHISSDAEEMFIKEQLAYSYQKAAHILYRHNIKIDENWKKESLNLLDQAEQCTSLYFTLYNPVAIYVKRDKGLLYVRDSKTLKEGLDLLDEYLTAAKDLQVRDSIYDTWAIKTISEFMEKITKDSKLHKNDEYVLYKVYKLLGASLSFQLPDDELYEKCIDAYAKASQFNHPEIYLDMGLVAYKNSNFGIAQMYFKQLCDYPSDKLSLVYFKAQALWFSGMITFIYNKNSTCFNELSEAYKLASDKNKLFEDCASNMEIENISLIVQYINSIYQKERKKEEITGEEIEITYLFGRLLSYETNLDMKTLGTKAIEFASKYYYGPAMIDYVAYSSLNNCNFHKARCLYALIQSSETDADLKERYKKTLDYYAEQGYLYAQAYEIILNTKNKDSSQLKSIITNTFNKYPIHVFKTDLLLNITQEDSQVIDSIPGHILKVMEEIEDNPNSSFFLARGIVALLSFKTMSDSLFTDYIVKAQSYLNQAYMLSSVKDNSTFTSAYAYLMNAIGDIYIKKYPDSASVFRIYAKAAPFDNYHAKFMLAKLFIFGQVDLQEAAEFYELTIKDLNKEKFTRIGMYLMKIFLNQVDIPSKVHKTYKNWLKKIKLYEQQSPSRLTDEQLKVLTSQMNETVRNKKTQCDPRKKSIITQKKEQQEKAINCALSEFEINKKLQEQKIVNAEQNLEGLNGFLKGNDDISYATSFELANEIQLLADIIKNKHISLFEEYESLLNDEKNVRALYLKYSMREKSLLSCKDGVIIYTKKNVALLNSKLDEIGQIKEMKITLSKMIFLEGIGKLIKFNTIIPYDFIAAFEIVLAHNATNCWKEFYDELDEKTIRSFDAYLDSVMTNNNPSETEVSLCYHFGRILCFNELYKTRGLQAILFSAKKHNYEAQLHIATYPESELNSIITYLHVCKYSFLLSRGKDAFPADKIACESSLESYAKQGYLVAQLYCALFKSMTYKNALQICSVTTLIDVFKSYSPIPHQAFNPVPGESALLKLLREQHDFCSSIISIAVSGDVNASLLILRVIFAGERTLFYCSNYIEKLMLNVEAYYNTLDLERAKSQDYFSRLCYECANYFYEKEKLNEYFKWSARSMHYGYALSQYDFAVNLLQYSEQWENIAKICTIDQITSQEKCQEYGISLLNNLLEEPLINKLELITIKGVFFQLIAWYNIYSRHDDVKSLMKKAKQLGIHDLPESLLKIRKITSNKIHALEQLQGVSKFDVQNLLNCINEIENAANNIE